VVEGIDAKRLDFTGYRPQTVEKVNHLLSKLLVESRSELGMSQSELARHLYERLYDCRDAHGLLPLL